MVRNLFVFAATTLAGSIGGPASKANAEAICSTIDDTNAKSGVCVVLLALYAGGKILRKRVAGKTLWFPTKIAHNFSAK